MLQASPTGILEIQGGKITTTLAVAIPTANVKGGKLEHNGSGTITSAVLTGGELDMSQSNVPRTITALSITGDADIVLDPDVVTLTGDIVAALGEPLRISSNRTN
jgi:hypothetical protein